MCVHPFDGSLPHYRHKYAIAFTICFYNTEAFSWKKWMNFLIIINYENRLMWPKTIYLNKSYNLPDLAKSLDCFTEYANKFLSIERHQHSLLWFGQFISILGQNRIKCISQRFLLWVDIFGWDIVSLNKQLKSIRCLLKMILRKWMVMLLLMWRLLDSEV